MKQKNKSKKPNTKYEVKPIEFSRNEREKEMKCQFELKRSDKI